MQPPWPPLPAPAPLPRQSRFVHGADKWGPAGVMTVLGAVASIVYAMNANADLKSRLETLERQQATTQKELGELRDKHNALRTNQARWRVFADAAFCRLDVRVPHGCPAVDYHPTPMRGSRAPKIQPAVATEPLFENETADPTEE